jgi:hypothetical protein
MDQSWKISDGLARHLATVMVQFVERAGEPDFEYCPAILWSLGGDVRKATGELVNKVPPGYGLAVIKLQDIAEQGFATVMVPSLGIVAFSPEDADLASAKRMIDFTGDAIVVR